MDSDGETLLCMLLPLWYPIGDEAIAPSVSRWCGDRVYTHERVARPVFGGNLNDLLFELADNPTISTLAPRIENVINNEEPRAEVQDIKVYNEADRNSIRCVITFKVVNVQELVTLTTSVSRIR